MANLAILLFGIGAALIAAAAPMLLILPRGVDRIGMVIATAALLVGAGLGERLLTRAARVPRVHGRRGIAAPLAVAIVAVLTAVSPDWFCHVGGLAVSAGPPLSASLMCAAALSMCPVGFAMMLALRALHGHARVGIRRRFAIFTIGAAIGTASAPTVLFSTAGLHGAVALAAAIFGVAAGLCWIDRRVNDGGAVAEDVATRVAPERQFFVLLCGAPGLLVGVTAAIVSLANGETAADPYPTFAVALGAAAAGALLASLLRPQAHLRPTLIALAGLAAVWLARRAPDPHLLEQASALAAVRLSAVAPVLTGLHQYAVLLPLATLVLFSFAAALRSSDPAGSSYSAVVVAALGAAIGFVFPRTVDVLPWAALIGAASLFGLALLRAFAVGRAGSVHPIWMPAILALAAIRLAFPALPTDPSDDHAIARSFEADGTRFEVRGPRADGSGTAVLWLDGVPARPRTPARAPEQRLLAISLCMIEAPRRACVLGAGGLETAIALATLTETTVEWVTPLAGEAAWGKTVTAARGAAVTVRHALERSFLFNDDAPLDLVVFPPPVRPPQYQAHLLTNEFLQRVRERLGDDGLMVMLAPLRDQPAARFSSAIVGPLIAALPDFVIFVDHPRNPDPAVAILAGRESTRLPADRIAARIAGSATIGRILHAADLDARGVLQCYLLDRDVLRLWIPEPWTNEDARPRLCLMLGPAPRYSTDVSSISYLQVRRATARGRFDPLDPNSQIGNELARRAMRDFESTTELINDTVRRIGAGVTGPDPETRPPPDDQELTALWSASIRSPTLALTSNPIERAIEARKASGRQREAAEMLRRATHLDRNRLDRHLELASLDERLGNVAPAEATYRLILQRSPGHNPARIRLARLLAGKGRAGREEAKTLLEETLRGGDLSATDAALGGEILHGLNGDEIRASALSSGGAVLSFLNDAR